MESRVQQIVIWQYHEMQLENFYIFRYRNTVTLSKKAEQNNSFNTIQSKILTLKRMLNTAFNDSRRNILRNAQYKTYETRLVV